jgi:hypothetical protein
MLTEDELAALESLLVRARAAAGQARSESGGTVNVGDLVQLRPGADPHWQTSLLLVCKIRDDGRISGVMLRPHRSGSRDAWYAYSPPEVIRIGRTPFPPPEPAVSNASFLAQCPRCLGRDSGAPFLEPSIDPSCPKCSAAARGQTGDQHDGSEIAALQIGQRLWWVVPGGAPVPKPKRKPIQREGRRRKPPSLAEIQDAIAGLPKDQQSALAAWLAERAMPEKVS